MAPIVYRQVTDPADPALAQFGDLQNRTYADPDLLIPPRAFPYLLQRQTPERRNLILVAEADGAVVGGAIFHLFPGPNTGFSSYMAVAPQWRGQGLARGIHQARFATLDREAGKAVHGLFIDVVAPERLGPDELAQEQSVSVDPFARRQIFHRLGFRRVDVAYYQPPDSPGEAPITTMDLLYCARIPSDTVSTELIVRTMHAYWGPWLGRQAAEIHSEELRRRCGGESVPLRPA